MENSWRVAEGTGRCASGPRRRLTKFQNSNEQKITEVQNENRSDRHVRAMRQRLGLRRQSAAATGSQRTVQHVPIINPKGIVAPSPGLRGTSYAGNPG